MSSERPLLAHLVRAPPIQALHLPPMLSQVVYRSDGLAQRSHVKFHLEQRHAPYRNVHRVV